MDPQERKMLERVVRLCEQNAHDIQKIYRAIVVGRVFKVLYWVVIIGIAVGAFYFVQPYLEQLQETYTGIQGRVESVGGILDTISGQ